MFRVNKIIKNTTLLDKTQIYVSEYNKKEKIITINIRPKKILGMKSRQEVLTLIENIKSDIEENIDKENFSDYKITIYWRSSSKEKFFKISNYDEANKIFYADKFNFIFCNGFSPKEISERFSNVESLAISDYVSNSDEFKNCKDLKFLRLSSYSENFTNDFKKLFPNCKVYVWTDQKEIRYIS
ncbi:MAG: hypothetical protein LBM93_13505 [Oscillospiraceae bacterium]|nr:hypothetical protein [Oscillospiraceae bacterium]